MKFSHFVLSLFLCLLTVFAAASASGMQFTTSSGGSGTINFNLRPDADFDYKPKIGPAPLFVVFENRSRFAENIQWQWWVESCVDYQAMGVDLDEDTVSSAVIPYLHPGQYAVYLQAENNAGTDVELRFVEVTDPMPFAVDFQATPRSGFVGTEVSFTQFIPYEGVIGFSYQWDFGDGSGSTERNPTHTYTTAGDFNISLNVTDCTGWYADFVWKPRLISIVGAPTPQVDFIGSPTTGPEKTTVNFVNTTQGNFSSSLWDFGDAASTHTSDRNISHQYNEAGTYTVTLTIFNEAGTFSTTKTDYITIEDDAPQPPPQVIVDFYGAPRNVLVGSNVYFYNNTEATHDQALWSFGDGTGSKDANPTHKYSNAGVYSVTLQVIGGFGAVERTKNNYITVQAVESSDAFEPLFTADPVTGKSPHVVQFNNLTGFDLMDAWWDFGDGTTSNDSNPIHTYEQPGTYTVTLFMGDNAKTKLDYICTLPSSGNYQTPAILLLNGDQGLLAKIGAFRDAIVARSVYGTGLKELYYKHALELTAILEADPVLFTEVQNLLASCFAQFESSLDNGTFTIPTELRPAIITVLGSIADQAGPELSGALIKLMKDLDNDDFFQNINSSAPVN